MGDDATPPSPSPDELPGLDASAMHSPNMMLVALGICVIIHAMRTGYLLWPYKVLTWRRLLDPITTLVVGIYLFMEGVSPLGMVVLWWLWIVPLGMIFSYRYLKGWVKKLDEDESDSRRPAAQTRSNEPSTPAPRPRQERRSNDAPASSGTPAPQRDRRSNYASDPALTVLDETSRRGRSPERRQGQRPQTGGNRRQVSRQQSGQRSQGDGQPTRGNRQNGNSTQRQQRAPQPPTPQTGTRVINLNSGGVGSGVDSSQLKPRSK